MKLEMNRAWNKAIALIGANKDVLFVVAGVFFFLPYLALMLAVPELAGSTMGPESADPEAALQQMGALYASFWWMIVLLSLIQAAGMLGLMALLADHRRPTLGEALKIGALKTLPYVAAYLLVGLALGLLIVLVIASASAAGAGVAVLLTLVAMILALYAAVKFSLVPAILVKEDISNPLAALARSWKITKGNSVRLFFFYFLLVLVMIVIMMVLSVVTGLVLALLGGSAVVFGTALLSAAINAVWVTLFLAVIAAVHDQLGGTGSAEIAETFE